MDTLEWIWSKAPEQLVNGSWGEIVLSAEISLFFKTTENLNFCIFLTFVVQFIITQLYQNPWITSCVFFICNSNEGPPPPYNIVPYMHHCTLLSLCTMRQNLTWGCFVGKIINYNSNNYLFFYRFTTFSKNWSQRDLINSSSLLFVLNSDAGTQPDIEVYWKGLSLVHNTQIIEKGFALGGYSKCSERKRRSFYGRTL